MIGRGQYIAPLSLEQTDLNTTYTIDVDRKLRPCKVANGLDWHTYLAFPSSCFAEIIFEHMSFSPLYESKMLTATGYTSLKTAMYTAEIWQDMYTKPNICGALPSQLYRILKPGGILTFKTFILENLEDFKRVNLLSEHGENDAHQVWRHYYEKAGFEAINISNSFDSTRKGHYLEMIARKPHTFVKQASFNNSLPPTLTLE